MKTDTREIMRYLMMGGRRPDGELARRIEALGEKSRCAIRPKETYKRFEIGDGAISSGALTLRIAGSLARHIEGCRAAYLACATLGTGFDALLRRASAVSGADALVLQAIGAATIESLMDEMETKIKSELAPGETLVPRYSPGYGDFPLSAQRVLMALLDAPRTVGVSLTENLMMVPSKSVSAVIGVKLKG